MAEYVISGIWTNMENIVTDFAVHRKEGNTIYVYERYTLQDAITLVENKSNLVYTMMWDYVSSKWSIGEEVTTVKRNGKKYLRSKPDTELYDNLKHLIDYSYILIL